MVSAIISKRKKHCFPEIDVYKRQILYIENILCGDISYEEHSVPEIFDIERISH